MKITVTGSSDDLIEIGGDIVEEWGAYNCDDGRLLAVSDGTLLRIVYDQDGIWRMSRLIAGSATYSHAPGDVEADTFDVATLEGDIRWVALAKEWVKP